MAVTWLIPFAIVAVAALVWWMRHQRDDRRFAVAQSRPEAELCSHAHLIDGRNHIPVDLTLERRQIVYGNGNLEGSIQIGQIDEVEYGSDLVTGGIADGAVLRLRAHGRALEFVLDMTSAERWSALLPPHRLNDPGQVHTM
jgi:hypothetical protein